MEAQHSQSYHNHIWTFYSFFCYLPCIEFFHWIKNLECQQAFIIRSILFQLQFNLYFYVIFNEIFFNSPRFLQIIFNFHLFYLFHYENLIFLYHSEKPFFFNSIPNFYQTLLNLLRLLSQLDIFFEMDEARGTVQALVFNNQQDLKFEIGSLKELQKYQNELFLFQFIFLHLYHLQI